MLYLSLFRHFSCSNLHAKRLLICSQIPLCQLFLRVQMYIFIRSLRVFSHNRFKGPKQHLSKGCKMSVTWGGGGGVGGGGDFNRWILSCNARSITRIEMCVLSCFHQITKALDGLCYSLQMLQTSRQIFLFPSTRSQKHHNTCSSERTFLSM